MTTAYWCVLAAALIPFLFTAVAKLKGGRYNNRAPREWQARLEGAPARAHAAHLNSFEAFPFFAAAAIIAHLRGLPQETINLLAVATNDTGRSARQIIEIYERRWSIEVLFKELRGLGLGQYQMLCRNGIHRHLVLVGLAHLTLTRHALARLDAPARKQKRIPLPRCQERLADFRQSVRHDQIQALTNRIRHAPTRNQLRQALTAL